MEELAQRADISPQQLVDLESGVEPAPLTLLQSIAGVLPLTKEPSRRTNYRIEGKRPLSGSIEVRSSKNAAVALLCASLLNRGTTTLVGVAQIEEVNRIIEVLTSIGVSVEWSTDRAELTISRPAHLKLEAMDIDAARRTRSIIMFFGPLLLSHDAFSLPYAGGCNLGARTIEPHLQALQHFGLHVAATTGYYRARVELPAEGSTRNITLTERGDTVTENVLMAAAQFPGETVIRNASSNYMVQDLCFYLQALGVDVEGIGTTTLRVRGLTEINKDITFAPSEDPIEAMSLITAGIVTDSKITITRAPIEFLEIELAILAEMGLKYSLSDEYLSYNEKTRLVDITVHPSHLRAAVDKIHPMPFPGLNIDNLPFFAVIAAAADGSTLIHDWVYESRAIHLVDLSKLGADVQLLDAHRILVQGPTKWRATETMCPPALRPAVCLLLAALGAQGTSTLRDVYVITRGYEDLPNRLNALGANIVVTHY